MYTYQKSNNNREPSMTPPRGGLRPGAGQKPGHNAYGEPTRPIRVPVSLFPDLERLLDRLKATRGAWPAFAEVSWPTVSRTPLALPLFLSRVPAGFPSPADDYVEKRLDLNEHLIDHPAATFFVRVKGDSMEGAGIRDGDLLVVDRALEPGHGRIVIAVVNGELTVKRLALREGEAWLEPENPAYAPLKLTEGLDCIVWGVVKHVIHAV
jgi:DNA polymerase V